MGFLLTAMAALKLRLLRRRSRRQAGTAAAAAAAVADCAAGGRSAAKKSASGAIDIAAVAGPLPLPQLPGTPPPPPPPAAAPPAAPEPSLPCAASLAAAASCRIVPSTQLTPSLVRRLETELVGGGRNRFVCMLLATQAREQMEAVAAAWEAGDAVALAAADRLCFGCVEAGTGELVAAAVFYPRARSPSKTKSSSGVAAEAGARSSHSGACPCPPPPPAPPAPSSACVGGSAASSAAGDAAGGDNGGTAASVALRRPCGAPAAVGLPTAVQPAGMALEVDPHLYVELIVTCQPGRGWGSLLLRAIEAHAAAAATTASGGTVPLRSVKLLSVEGAQRFYAAHGYCDLQGGGELCKPVAAVAPGA